MFDEEKNGEFLTEDGIDKGNMNDSEMDKDFKEGEETVSPSVYEEEQDSYQEIQDRGEAAPKDGEDSCQEAQGNEDQENIDKAKRGFVHSADWSTD